MIHFCSQNWPRFRQAILHWSQISFPGAFFSAQQKASSRWRPDLKNTVSEEAIEALFIQFDHRFHGLVARCIALAEHHFLLLHVRLFFLDF